MTIYTVIRFNEYIVNKQIRNVFFTKPPRTNIIGRISNVKEGSTSQSITNLKKNAFPLSLVTGIQI
jgi:hypothetical protein